MVVRRLPIYLLVFLFILPCLSQIDFLSVPWKIEYAKYRLWYEVNLTENATQVWIYFEIPDSILNDVLKYCQDHNYTYCEMLFPRVYYYNVSSGEQIQIPCRWEGTAGNEPVPYCIVHSYRNLTVYMENLPAGTHYFVIYYPWYFWEDFEDLPLGQQISTVGQCFSDGWCVIDDYLSRYAKIESNGWEPTPQKRLYLHSFYSRIALKREVNISINPNYPLIAEWDVSASSSNLGGEDVWIGFEFLLKDGSKVTLRYKIGGMNNYIPSGVNVCNTVTVGQGHIKRDILRDLTQYCGIYINNVASLTAIYLVNYQFSGTTSSYWDNIKIIPWDIINYFP